MLVLTILFTLIQALWGKGILQSSRKDNILKLC